MWEQYLFLRYLSPPYDGFPGTERIFDPLLSIQLEHQKKDGRTDVEVSQ